MECVCLLCVDGPSPGKHTPHRAQVLTCGLTVTVTWRETVSLALESGACLIPSIAGASQHRVLEPGWCSRPSVQSLCSLFCLVSHSPLACRCLPLSASPSSSCISLVFQALQSNLKYSLLPRRLLISKRLAQCLHPALPSGVHLKALETYEIIFKIVGTKWLAKDLFLYRYASSPRAPFITQ